MVNVLEIDKKIKIPKNILKELFSKQMDLTLKYLEIENMGDLLKHTESNLDTNFGQVWIKDFIYRAIEEVGESFEVIRNYVKEELWDYLSDNLKIHYAEEIIDALHFFIEMCIICGYDSFHFKPIETYGLKSLIGTSYEDFESRHWKFVESITLAGNCLRNKKWKQHHVLTDRNKFKYLIEESFERLIGILKSIGYNDTCIYMLYCKKNEVNKFRQKSKY